MVSDSDLLDQVDKQADSSICWYTTKQEAIHLWERQASSGLL